MHSLIITPSSAYFMCYIFGLASALASTSSQLASVSRPKITASASALASCTYGLVNIPGGIVCRGEYERWSALVMLEAEHRTQTQSREKSEPLGSNSNFTHIDFKLQLSCCHRSIFVAAATYMYSAAFEQNIASERRSELMRYYSVSLLGLLHFILHHFYINLSIFRHNRWRLPCRVTTLTYIRIYSSGRISMCVFLVLRSCWCTTLWTYR